MKARKKTKPLCLIFLLTCFLLTGCSNNTGTSFHSSDTAQSNSNVLNFSGSSLSGTVTDVDGHTITLSLNSGMYGGQMPSGGTPPEQPAADNNIQSPADNSQTPPELSATNTGTQTPPEQPPAAATIFTLTIADETVLQDSSLSDITEGSLLTITFNDKGIISSVTVTSRDNENPAGNSPENGSSSVESSANNGTSAITISKDTEDTGTSYISDKEDENALRIDEAVHYSGTGITIQKSGNTSNTENSDFYGLNAGFLSTGQSSSLLTNSTIRTDAKGANGIFAYGENTHVTVSDTNITTTADNSGGIDVTGGASLEASNLNIKTSGQSCAAIRSDRGGGTITVSQGTYTTDGTGSPSVYCTADISVADAVLTANASEGIVIEGKNSVTLDNCQVTGNMQGTYHGDENENLHTIMIYQSMSGDASEGCGTLTVNGGSITGLNGDLIYSTNTSSILNLNHVALTLSNDVLLRVTGNDSARGWGEPGCNGADMRLFAKEQKLEGRIIVDEISSLLLTLSENSSFEGSINAEQEGGKVNVVLDDSSTWKLTGNSYITSFEGSLEQIEPNGYTLYIDGTAADI